MATVQASLVCRDRFVTVWTIGEGFDLHRFIGKSFIPSRSRALAFWYWHNLILEINEKPPFGSPFSSARSLNIPYFQAKEKLEIAYFTGMIGTLSNTIETTLWDPS